MAESSRSNDPVCVWANDQSFPARDKSTHREISPADGFILPKMCGCCAGSQVPSPVSAPGPLSARCARRGAGTDRRWLVRANTAKPIFKSLYLLLLRRNDLLGERGGREGGRITKFEINQTRVESDADYFSFELTYSNPTAGSPRLDFQGDFRYRDIFGKIFFQQDRDGALIVDREQ